MEYDYPYIVIGAGAGGLVIAIGLAKAGYKVLLIEKGTYGGDCTNFGCIPSKSLIASSEVAHLIKQRKEFGIHAEINEIHCAEALSRVRSIVDAFKKEEEPEALSSHGVETLTGTASFINPHELSVLDQFGAEKTVTGNKIVIATGSSPIIPNIDGLDQVPYLTNETIFDLDEIPEDLAVIGGGPIGCELAQAFQRIGCRVSLIQKHSHLLQKEEEEAQELLKNVFQTEKISLFLNELPLNVAKVNDKIRITLKNDNETKDLIATHLLISTGRKPNIEKLKLQNCGVNYTPKGITVDSYGRTSQKHIYAIGDVVGRAVFTHVAENEARTVLINLLIPWPFKKKLDLHQQIPRVTYTDPEIAAIGLQEPLAIEIYGKTRIAVYKVPLNKIDRAVTASQKEGFVKIITKKWSSKILGATIMAPRAGDMISEISLAMRHNIPLRKLSSLIHPYPTYSLGIRKTADLWLAETIIPTLKKWSGTDVSR